MKKILSKHENDPRWETFPLSDSEKKQLEEILSSSFIYLGSGKQCYVFASQNDQFVLKFFKQKHMRTQFFIDAFPLLIKKIFYPKKKYLRRRHARDKLFNSYKIAYEHLKKETRVFYLHLNKTNHLNQTVTLIDQHGKPIFIDIDKMEFLIQGKAEMGYQHLDQLFAAGKKDEALKCIRSLISVISCRIEKGFLDDDLLFHTNFGFIGHQAVEIDIGELCPVGSQRNAEDIREELISVFNQLIIWVRQHYPKYRSDVEKEIEDDINQFYMSL